MSVISRDGYGGVHQAGPPYFLEPYICPYAITSVRIYRSKMSIVIFNTESSKFAERLKIIYFSSFQSNDFVSCNFILIIMRKTLGKEQYICDLRGHNLAFPTCHLPQIQF